MTRNSLFAIEALNAYKNQLHPSPVEIGKKGGKNATKMRSTSGVLNYFDEESMRFGAIFFYSPQVLLAAKFPRSIGPQT
jgi:hypothetical protein